MVTSDEERQSAEAAANAEASNAPAPPADNDAMLADDAQPSPAEAPPEGSIITAEVPEPEPAIPEDDPEGAEDVGRHVESLLAEAPDGDPENEFPPRGESPAEPVPAAFDLDPRPTLPDSEPVVLATAPVSPTTPSRPTARAGMDRVGPIIAFDFDGTLTVRDSFTAFLKWREGSARYHAEMAALAPAALRYVFDRDPGKLKAAAVRRFLQGLPRDVLNAEAMEFATSAAPLLFRPDALKAWRRYRLDGARLIIVTASPENIVAPFARGLGADLLIGTRLLFDQEDRVQGGLMGDNCRGPAKVKRIKEALGEDVVLTAAYGDTDGDWDMLGMAEQQFMRLFVGVPGSTIGST